MRKYLQGISVAYGLLMILALAYGSFEVFPWLTVAYTIAVTMYAYEVIQGGFVLLGISVLFAIFWLSNATGVYDLLDIGFAISVIVATLKLEKK